jgi:hypothetical protein
MSGMTHELIKNAAAAAATLAVILAGAAVVVALSGMIGTVIGMALDH